jgi:hypothetical protein
VSLLIRLKRTSTTVKCLMILEMTDESTTRQMVFDP